MEEADEFKRPPNEDDDGYDPILTVGRKSLGSKRILALAEDVSGHPSSLG